MQLTRLAVTSCSLRELPDGPYLSSLQELNLFANQLEWVPARPRPPSAGAPGRPLPCSIAEPAVEWACLDRPPPIPSPPPRSRVPPALAGVSGLRLLDLSSNYSLQLSGADVATLAQLPALALLDLSTQYGGGGEGGAHPADALAELRSALPRCEVRA